ncbi:unnamed protein product [Parnassius apollo]|uniref:(apollo) hypothetical protein n=1 Tax=Parnassius apollo TaxID=110799 RepID=A0A8S3XWF6_PARAO|nr:unnamed protein product [Parnassius apollo]
MNNPEPPRKKRREVVDKHAVPSTSRKVLSVVNSNVDRQIVEWLAQEDSSGSEAEDVPENYAPEHSDHNTETEASASEDEQPTRYSSGLSGRSSPVMLQKNQVTS